jgi:hypothetical protein
MRTLPAICIVALACGDDSTPIADGGVTTDGGGPDAGVPCSVLAWDPESGDIQRWPESDLEVADPSTGTGVRIEFDTVKYASLTERLGNFRGVFTDDLPELDGFGSNAAAYFRIHGGPLDPTRLPVPEATGEVSTPLGLVLLGDTPALVPVQVEFEHETLLLTPMVPLPGKAKAAVFITGGLASAAPNGCFEGSDAMSARIASPGDPDDAAAIDALVGLGVIAAPSELLALTAFTVQSTVDSSAAVARDIAERDFALEEAALCVEQELAIVCDGAIAMGDYRDSDGVVRLRDGVAAPVRTYRLPVRIWLPKTGERPFPTLVFGHGLNSDRTQGEELADAAVPHGYAVVAIDALIHGLHPTSPGTDLGAIERVAAFFSIGDLAMPSFHGLEHREHWRQSTFDKLQLTGALVAGMDVDGDGTVDLDGTRLGYVGVSLGGIMGPELLALTDAYSAGIVSVPGGRISSILSEGTFAGIVLLLRPPRTTDGDITRFFPVVQTILDGGDPATFASQTFTDRPLGGRAPSVLMTVALGDEIVPNVASWALARAYRMPIVAEVLEPVPGLSGAAMTPLSGNVAGGAATAGLLQFDVIAENGMREDAQHGNTPGSDVAARAYLEFLDSHFADGLAVIVDPYELEGLPHGVPP